MNLSIKERILLINLYPEKSDFVTQNIIRDISEKTKINEEEIKEVNLRLEDNKWLWDTTKDAEKDFEFSSAELDSLKNQVNRLDQEKAITQVILDLCKKIKDA